MKTQTRSDAVQNGTNLATTSQHNANRVNLPKQFAPYVAPHLRTHTVSRAIGSSGSLRTYSRVPLHLRGKTRNSNDTTKTSNAKNNSNIADGDIGIATIFKTVTLSSRQLSRWCVDSHVIFASVVASLVTCLIALTFALVCFALKVEKCE